MGVGMGERRHAERTEHAETARLTDPERRTSRTLAPSRWKSGGSEQTSSASAESGMRWRLKSRPTFGGETMASSMSCRARTKSSECGARSRLLLMVARNGRSW